MTTYYLDDGGSNTAPYDTAAKAANAWATLAAIPLVAGDIVLVETTHSETSSSSDLNLGGVAASPGIVCVRVDTTSSDSYDPDGATDNFITTTGNYKVDFNGAGAYYGLHVNSNEAMVTGQDTDAGKCYFDCHFTIGPGDQIDCTDRTILDNATIKSNDSGDTTSPLFIIGGDSSIRNCTVTGNAATYRNTLIADAGNGSAEFVGCDFSAMTRNPMRLVSSGHDHPVSFIDCKLPPNYTPWSAVTDTKRICHIIRCNGTDEIEIHAENGSAINEDTIVRTGGASNSLECITNAFCGFGNPFFTPWIHGVVDSASSTNFDVHVAYSGTRMTKENLFVELQFIDSAAQPYGTVVTSQERALLGDTVGNHATASETWGGSETYEEYIRITATPGVADTAFRARVGIEQTSQTDEVYVDAKVETS